MEFRRFGKTDMNVGVIGFGGAEIGFQQSTQDNVNEVLNAALDAGLNVIDTAECYPNSEEMIGQAVGHRRKDYFLFTKCGHFEHYAKDDWRPESLLQSIERSLKRLNTDVLDLVQLHTCSEAELKKGDVIAALQTARQRGWTRYIGYSGDSLAAQFAIECGAFDSLQTSVNIVDQEAIELTLPLAVKANIGVIVKRPIANAVWRYDADPDEAYHMTYYKRIQKLKYDFAVGDRGQAASIALRFTLGQPGVHTAIVGTTKPRRWMENVKLWEAGPLPAAQVEAIRNRFKEVADASWIGQS